MNKHSPRVLLVTGGAGFIGANFVRYYLSNHPYQTIIVLDKLTYAGHTSSLAGLADHYSNYHFVKGDINNSALVASIFREHHVDTVVHFAGESHVDRSIEDASIFLETNVLGTHNLLKTAKHFWLDEWQLSEHRFHHISTDEVYGTLSPDDAPFTETHQYSPNSPYAASKAGADHVVRAFHVTYGLNTTISHCSNNYGPYHLPEKLIPLAIVRMLHGGAIPIYGDGKQIRDWLYVEDHCRAVSHIIHHGVSGERYNVGGYDGEITNIELIQLLCDKMDRYFSNRPHYRAKFPQCPASQGQSCRALIHYVKDRLGHDRRYAINSDKIQRELQFQYQTVLEDGLSDMLAWYLNHEDWWRPLFTLTESTQATTAAA